MSEVLKPCPMCGGEPSQNGSAGAGAYGVFCRSGHYVQTYGRTEAEAIAAWNTRAEPAGKPVACAGCEGKPTPENSPCGVCGALYTHPATRSDDAVSATTITSNIANASGWGPKTDNYARVYQGAMLGAAAALEAMGGADAAS